MKISSFSVFLFSGFFILSFCITARQPDLLKPKKEINTPDSGGDNSCFGMRARSVPLKNCRIYEPVFIRESPANEATIIDLRNGPVKIFFINRPGNADKLMSVTSTDHGLTWSNPAEEFSLPGEAYYANKLVRDKCGELHCVFHIFGKGDNGYNGRHLDLWYCKTRNHGSEWTTPEKIYNGYVGSIRGFIQLESGRLLLAFARAVPSRMEEPLPGATDYGWNEIISMYSDDSGHSWFTSDNGIIIPVESTQVTRYGGVEPVIIELMNNKIWMLIRTNKGNLYQSYSENSGRTWNKPERTNFISSDSPAEILRLSDDRIVVFWSGNQRWDDNRSYANGGREVLHAAISDDDGKTWKGYREVLVSPSGHFVIKRDVGTAYPSSVETKEGKVLFVSGQSEERAVVMFDPDWLEKSWAKDSFKENLSQWTLFGADSSTCLVPLSPGNRKKGLLIRKETRNRNFDTQAVWNFPMTKKGEIVMEITLHKGCKGVSLALTDHFSVSYDTLASENAPILFQVENPGNNSEIKIMKLRIKWDCLIDKAFIYQNNTLLQEENFRRKAAVGLNYLRVGIPGNESDMSGFMVNSVRQSQ